MLTPELIERVKRELDAGMPRADVMTAMRIAGLTQTEVDQAFSILGIASKPASPPPQLVVEPTPPTPQIPPAPQAQPVRPVLPQTPPPAMVTKMPNVPAQALQTPPVSTEAEFLAPSVKPEAVKMPLPQSAAPQPPMRPISGTIKMPPPPPAQARVLSETVVMPAKRSRSGLIISIFLLLIIAAGGVGGYAYLQKIGPFADVGTVPYSTPLPISATSQVPSALPAATTSVPVISASSSSATTSVSAAQVNATSTTANVLECSGVKISLPEKWYALLIPKPQAQGPMPGADGCYKDSVGCVCLRKDSVAPGASVVFSVAVTQYASGGKLTDIMQALSHGRPENVKSTTLLGTPAMQFTTTGTNDNTGSLIFLKNQKLYVFTFDAQASTFKELWPDIFLALQDTKFK